MSKPPVNLNLFTIQFPITALSSISHRISDLIFLLNQLEKNNPHTYPNGTKHCFEYRLAQYQNVEYPDAE